MESVIRNPRGFATRAGVYRLLSAYLSHRQPAECPTRADPRGMGFAAQQSQKAQPANPRLLHRHRGLGNRGPNEGHAGQQNHATQKPPAC